MKISIIVPAHNESLVIRDQLDALVAQQAACDWEVIVADNGSTDDTVEIVREYSRRFPAVRVIDASQGKGAAYARNTGAKVAEGDYLAFLDADDVADSGWLDAMSKALREGDFLASRWDCDRLNSIDTAHPYRSRTCTQTQGVQEYRYPPFLPHSGGCGLVIKRSLHEKVGGFDESIRLLEDTDYCWRVQLDGAPLKFVPDALVYIRFPTHYRGVSRQAREWGEFNVLLYKLYQDRGMPKLKLSDGLKAWWELLKKVPRLYRPQVRARWLREFNWRLGRIIGSLKHRILAM